MCSGSKVVGQGRHKYSITDMTSSMTCSLSRRKDDRHKKDLINVGLIYTFFIEQFCCLLNVENVTIQDLL